MLVEILLGAVLVAVVLHLAWDAGWLAAARRWWRFSFRPGTRARKWFRKWRR